MGTGAMDLVMVVDVESNYEDAFHQGKRFDPKTLAQTLDAVARSYGPRTRCIAIVSKHDTASMNVMRRWGYELLPVNGDRPQALEALQDELTDLVSHGSPQKLIIASPDPSFIRLGQQVAQQTRVAIWGSRESALLPVSPEIDNRPLEEIIPSQAVHQIDARLDYENLHFGLLKAGLPYAPQIIIGVVRKIAERRGKLQSITAYGDWQKVYIPNMDVDIQRELALMDVRTRYQINGYGKNSADMEIANDLRSLVEGSQGDSIDEVILGTQDRDFKPVIETLRERGKFVTLVGLTNGVSGYLKNAVDEIFYLDEWLPGAGN